MANDEEVRTVLGILASAYPGQFKVTEDSVLIYVATLADIPAPDLAMAARHHIATSKWPPTVAELREAHHALTKPATLTAMEAWGEVIQALRRVGSWGTPSWSSPLVEATVNALGGWPSMCAMDIQDTPTVRAQFRDAYNALLGRTETDIRLLPDARAARHRLAPPRPISSVIAGMLPAETRGETCE